MTLATMELTLDEQHFDGCDACTAQVRQAVEAADGIGEVELDRYSRRIVVRYDAGSISGAGVRALTSEALTQAESACGASHPIATPVLPARPTPSRDSCSCCATEAGNGDCTAEAVAPHEASEEIPPRHGETLTFMVRGMDCADCAASIGRQVSRIPGVASARVDFLAATLTVAPVAGQRHDATLTARVERAVRDAGYTATPGTETTASGTTVEPFWRRYRQLWSTAGAALLWGAAFALSRLGVPVLATDALYAAAVVVGGWRIARAGVVALARGRTIGIDLLMTVAVLGAAALGQWEEGAAVVVLFALGEALEGLTMDRTRNAVRALMDLAPREAALKTADGERRVPVEALVPGQVIVVRPGELVGADGRVVSGETTINQAPITGESLPVEKATGDEVFAGTVNQHGAIEVEVTKRAYDTTLARIITLVREAQSARAPSQRFVDQFAAYYTPAVIVAAALVAVLPPLLGQPFQPWLYKALVLLVIACPCALVISTPVAIVAGIGRASKMGVLVKGGAYLEALAGVRTLAFDKTGTLTEGRPSVTDIIPLGQCTEREVLALAATVESRSEHPLAGAVLRAAEARAVAWGQPEGFQALPGRGASGTVDGASIFVGSPRDVRGAVDSGVMARIETFRREGKTALVVERDGELAGIIAVADQARPDAARTVAALRAAGMRQVVMLTGDHAVTAQAIAAKVAIDDVRAELLPERKAEAVRELISVNGRVVMVGDGVNDAPALATATVGVAMGAMGSDTAIETADVALMGDDLLKLPALIRLSRATLATIRANITFSLAVKAVFLALTLVGVVNLWLAILADTGAALLVIANAMRLLRFQASTALPAGNSMPTETARADTHADTTADPHADPRAEMLAPVE